MNKQEIESMFMGELPDLEETQSGKDLIAIGEKRGEARGEARGIAGAILAFLETGQGPVPEATRQRLQALPLPQLQELLPLICRGMTLEQLAVWLAAHGSL